MSRGKGDIIMFYATYKNVGESDIAVFQSKQERDNWVNFKDPYSKAVNINVNNSTFKRIAISVDEAESRIKTMLHMKDEFNAGQEWYVLV